MMGPWTHSLYTRLYSPDPVHDAAQADLDAAAYEKKCPVCDYCDEPITDETFRQRIDTRGRIRHYCEACALERFNDEYQQLYTDDYIGV